jgi:hypothetical protein
MGPSRRRRSATPPSPESPSEADGLTAPPAEGAKTLATWGSLSFLLPLNDWPVDCLISYYLCFYMILQWTNIFWCIAGNAANCQSKCLGIKVSFSLDKQDCKTVMGIYI